MKEIIIEENEGPSFVYERTANYYETDQMGIIHHSNYIRWFEEARLSCLKQMGLSYESMEERGIMIPVLSVSCQYKSAVRYDDKIVIYVSITQFNGVKMKVAYEVRDAESGELRTTGESEHGFLDKNFRPLRLKRDFSDIFETLKQNTVL